MAGKQEEEGVERSIGHKREREGEVKISNSSGNFAELSERKRCCNSCNLRLSTITINFRGTFTGNSQQGGLDVLLIPIVP